MSQKKVLKKSPIHESDSCASKWSPEAAMTTLAWPGRTKILIVGDQCGLRAVCGTRNALASWLWSDVAIFRLLSSRLSIERKSKLVVGYPIAYCTWLFIGLVLYNTHSLVPRSMFVDKEALNSRVSSRPLEKGVPSYNSCAEMIPCRNALKWQIQLIASPISPELVATNSIDKYSNIGGHMPLSHFRGPTSYHYV